MDLLEGAFVLGRTLRPEQGTPDWSAAAAGIFAPDATQMVASACKARAKAGPASSREKPDDHIASPLRKVFADQEAIILALRRERRLGVKQLRNELIRTAPDCPVARQSPFIEFSLRHNEQVLKRPRRWRKE